MLGRIVLKGILMLLAYIYLVRRGYVYVIKEYVYLLKSLNIDRFNFSSIDLFLLGLFLCVMSESSDILVTYAVA